MYISLPLFCAGAWNVSPRLTWRGGRTYVRFPSNAYLFSEPKFLGCKSNQIFLPMVLRFARFARERAPLSFLYLGECWSGTDDSPFFLEGHARQGQCADQCYNDCGCSTRFCAGKNFTNAVYAISKLLKMLIIMKYSTYADLQFIIKLLPNPPYSKLFQLPTLHYNCENSVGVGTLGNFAAWEKNLKYWLRFPGRNFFKFTTLCFKIRLWRKKLVETDMTRIHRLLPSYRSYTVTIMASEVTRQRTRERALVSFRAWLSREFSQLSHRRLQNRSLCV